MESKKVINKKNLPSRIPLVGTIVYITALDYWNAPEWLWGVVGVIMVVGWVSFFFGLGTEKEIDLFVEKKPETKEKSTSKFQEKLKEMQGK